MNTVSKMVHQKIRDMLLCGYSVRNICSALGVAKGTVTRYRFLLRRAGHDLRCQCGREGGHQGWCRWRFARSAARKAVMARMRHEA